MSPYIYVGLPKKAQMKYAIGISESSHEQILRAVTDYFGVTMSELSGSSRLREFVIPRQIAQYLMRTYTVLTLKEIGVIFNRDHSSVVASVRTVNDLLETDPKFRKQFNQISNKIKTT